MALSRDEIIEQLQSLVGAEFVLTDLETMQLSSVDRFRRYEAYHDVFSMPLPAAVVKAQSTQQVADIIAFANRNKVNVVARTGGSATEGGLETAIENSIVLDGSAMNNIINIDVENMQVTAQCGTSLQELDDKLRTMGYSTGHSPQSKPLAQMGGLVATRSIGQFSTLYGGIEDMVVGLEAVFPEGGITRIKNVPRRAAGPDIRHVVIGNEGALCFITEVTVKIFKYYPDNNRYLGYTLDSMKLGFEILREVMVEGYKPSVARLYDIEDGDYHFSHFAKGKCVLIFVSEGVKPIADATADAIEAIVAKHSECQQVDGSYIEKWFDHLNWDPANLAEEKREILEDKRICHTTEISGNWSVLNDLYETCMRKVRAATPNLTMLGAHSSHSYLNGTNLYFVYFYDVSNVAPADELEQCHLAIKKIIVEETIKVGGSMCHHHGVGKHRTQWIESEYGSSYYILNKLKQAYDPNGVMNMGTIIPLEK
jgi:alkyldihydroxyacetonephosphate synthase